MPESRLQVVAKLADMLAGKPVKIVNADHRMSVVGAIKAMAKATLTGPARAEMAGVVAAALTTAFDKESNPVAGLAIVSGLQAFAEASKPPNTAIVRFATEKLADAKSKSDLKLAALKCLLATYTGDQTCEAKDLCGALAKLMAAKGTSTAEIALAATLVLRVSAADSEVAVSVKAAKFWNKLTDPKFFTDKLFQADDETLAYTMEMIELALSGSFADDLPDVKWATIHDCAVRLLVHPSWVVRKNAQKRVWTVLGNLASPQTHQGVLAALANHLAAGEAKPHHLEQAYAAVATCPNQSGTALLTLLPAHSSALPAGQGAARWQYSLRANGLSSKALFKEHGDAIVELITGNVGTDLVASCQAVSTISSMEGSEAVVDALTGFVVATLGKPAFRDVTAHHVAVAATPTGQLFNDQQDDEIAKLSPNTKDYEEKLWELKVKQELAKKKKASAPVKKLSKSEEEKRRTQLAAEQSIRLNVATLRAESDAAFNIMLALSSASASYSGTKVTSAIPVLLQHTSLALTGERACVTWISLGAQTHTRILPFVEPLGYAILLARGIKTIPLAWSRADADTLIAKSMRRLWTVIHESDPIDLSSFAYVWPLLQAILTRANLPVAVHEDAMVFLTSHASLGRSQYAPRRGILNLLVHVAANLERMAMQASVFMKSFVEKMTSVIAAGIPITADEITIILRGLQAPELILRRACFDSLSQLADEPTDDMLLGMWLAKHDTDETVSKSADALWTSRSFALPAGVFEFLMGPLAAKEKSVREIAAKAGAAALLLTPGSAGDYLSLLSSSFQASLSVPEPERDHLGNVTSEAHSDPFWFRCGIATAIEAAAASWPTNVAINVLSFLVDLGIHDFDEKVRDHVVKAGLKLIDAAGAEALDQILEILEFAMEQRQGADKARQSLVILLGASAKHMDKTDPKIPEVLDSLLASLSTPSQSVQEAVGLCISPLMSAIKPRVPALLEQLLKTLLDGGNFGARRGAAYGIAGVVKGCGILALKQHGLTDALKAAIEDKKEAKHREGALMAYELLCVRLGRLFEPYIIHVLPNLLICFGDGNADVREAAQEASSAIMSKLSSHGVKLVLPSLLKGLNDYSWKVKQGSVQLLGAMSGCAPKQLSACLPSIVPKLQDTLSDSHQKVQQAGREALDKIGKVIKNPEVQNLVPKLLAALNDHEKGAQKCLTALLETAFVHVIDAASLSLIMPILQRGMVDRSVELKKSSAQIIGNMYSLTDPKDLAPYLPSLLPGIKEALLDPDPSVRGIAAKAMGSIMKGMGEANFPDLIPWLLETMKSKLSSVDRSGAAQGLAEVLFALGIDRFDAMLEEFLLQTEHKDSNVREGHLMLFVYLPMSFKNDFRQYIERIVPSLLKGLADVEEGVRDTAMRASAGIISNFSDTSIELLMPELERGLTSEEWRIRESSVKLLGEMLFQLSGVTGKQTTHGGDDDESFGTDEAELTIIGALGKERRNRLLAGLFMARQDSAILVRQASMHVWKVVVPHSSKTLRDVLPDLLNILLTCLGSQSEDKRETAARTLSEVLRKLGDRVLPTIFPILKQNVSAESSDERHGVCVSFTEILRTVGAEQLEEYEETLISSVASLLIDEDESVRESASATFSRLHICIGPKAIEEILPPMLTEISEQGDTSKALDGLKHIMSTMSRTVLPYVVPRLLTKPLTESNAAALGSLAAVAGASLNKHLNEILDVFMFEVNAAEDDEKYVLMKSSLRGLALAVDDDGIGTVLDKLQAGLLARGVKDRRTCSSLLADLCRDAESDFEDYYTDLIDNLLAAFRDDDATVVSDIWGALNALIGRFENDKPAYLSHTVGVLRSLTTAPEPINGFGIPDGIKPLLTFFVESISNGSPQMRLDAVEGLGFLVAGTEDKPLQKYVLKITGPIIRVASESSGRLKASCLSVVDKLLTKIPAKLKTMLPQLQPTCLKALRDQHLIVRNNALLAICKLAPLQRRVDPIFTDLCSGVSTAEGDGRLVFLKALTGVSVSGAGKVASDAAKQNMVTELSPLLDEDDEDVREWAARALGAISPHLADGDFDALQEDAYGDAGDWTGQTGRTMLLRDMVIFSDSLEKLDLAKLVAKLNAQFASENTSIQGASLAAAAAVLAHTDGASQKSIEKYLFLSLDSKETNKDVQIIAVNGLATIGRWRPELADTFMAYAVPLLLKCHKRKATSQASEVALVQLFGLVGGVNRVEAYAASASAADAQAFQTTLQSRLVHLAGDMVGKF